MSCEILDGQLSYLDKDGKLEESYSTCDKDKTIKLISKAALKNSIDDFSRHSQKNGLIFKVKIDSDFYPEESSKIERKSNDDRILGIRHFQNAFGFDAPNVSGYEDIIKLATVTAMALDFLKKNTGPGNEKNRKKQRKLLNK